METEKKYGVDYIYAGDTRKYFTGGTLQIGNNPALFIITKVEESTRKVFMRKATFWETIKHKIIGAWYDFWIW
jgi:hypothetical protein